MLAAERAIASGRSNVAATPQPIKEWGRLLRHRRGGTSARRWLRYSEEDLLRLRAIAQLRGRFLPGGMSWSDPAARGGAAAR